MKVFKHRGYDVVVVRGNRRGTSYRYLIHKDGVGSVSSMSLHGYGDSAFRLANIVAHDIIQSIRESEEHLAWVREREGMG